MDDRILLYLLGVYITSPENQYKKHDGSLDIIKRNALVDIDAKYIAMCEGDNLILLIAEKYSHTG